MAKYVPREFVCKRLKYPTNFKFKCFLSYDQQIKGQSYGYNVLVVIIKIPIIIII